LERRWKKWEGDGAKHTLQTNGNSLFRGISYGKKDYKVLSFGGNT